MMIIRRVKNIKRLLKKILVSVWFLGLIIAVPVILFLPGLFRKYEADLILEEPAAHEFNYRIYFRDLDGNGIKQKVYAFPNSAGQLAFQYFGDDGRMINQISFRHKLGSTLFFLFFGDANKNGKTEVYGFTMEKDSMFLNRKELSEPFTNTSESFFITRIGTFNRGDFNVSVNRFFVYDIDHDGKNEYVFSITTGYSKFPRMVVIMRPDTGEMIRSEDLGINPQNMTLVDLNGDRKMEIVAGSIASYNLADTTNIPIIDSRPYLLGYNSDLQLLFPPVPFSAGISNSIQFYVSSLLKKEITVFHFNRSLPVNRIIGIYKVGFDGNLRDSAFIPEFGKRFNYQVFHFHGNYYLFTGDKMVVISHALKVIDIKNIESSVSVFRYSVFSDGSPEFATLDHSLTRVFIYSEDFRHMVELKYTGETVKNIFLDIGKGPDHFMVQTSGNEYTYHFRRNGLYYLKYPIYFLIYLFSVLFVWLIQNIRERQFREKFELKNQLKDLEIKYLRMQMDPHFMFNAFTTMALMIKSGDRNEAFDSFMKFTRMLRSNFDFSDHLTRPLNEELMTVSNYLEINKLRFKDKLNYEIKVAEDVPVNTLIPKMILQIHIENSLKHGLSQLEKPGFIRIEVRKDGEYICMTVVDNGIGRQKAVSLNRPSTKQGIKMLQALMDRLNQHNKLSITQSYTDLEDEQGKPAGTRVDVLVPLNLKESGS